MSEAKVKFTDPNDSGQTDGQDDSFSRATALSGQQSVHDSARSNPDSGVYELIEYEAMARELEIGEDSPAAAALRASAAVHVSRAGKAARAVNIQAVRKIVKRATGSSKQGRVKGKPPRLQLDEPHQVDISEEGSEEEEEDRINEAHAPNQTNKLPPEPIPEIPDTNVNPGTAEAGKNLLHAVDPHNILKALRFQKKKKDDAQKPSYVKGKVIDGEHELYTLSIAVMIGVRTSISKTNTILNPSKGRRFVIPQDFPAAEKYEFRPKGGKGTPTHQLAHTFKFKDYAPVVFAYLRRMSGINEYDFLMSICGNASFIEFISNAKSGQFFFYSSDGRYMIKTMTNSECKFLRRILPEYFRHCCENPNTMITRFFGMYRVKLYHLRRNVKFVIMNSVYYTDKYLQSFYDLKGSVVGRDAKPGQAVKKDNDLRRVLPQDALALAPDVRNKTRKQLEKDTVFMEKMGIMDYSMLVGIHHIPTPTDRTLASAGYRMSVRRTKRSSMVEMAKSLRNVGIKNETKMEDSGKKDDVKPVLRLLTAGSKRLLADLTEGGLDDDESSYLEGSDRRVKDSHRVHESTEVKRYATIESLFWPFHHLYDIHGHRRLKPAKCLTCDKIPCECKPDICLKGYKIQDFVAPLSDRKDGGFEMDTTGLTLPMIYKAQNGQQQYEGKIFYMGIIDILQEYNSRKLMEAQYRSLQGSGKTQASCVNPRLYGNRFVSFFDEYTTRGIPDISQPETEGVEVTLEATQDFQEGKDQDKSLEPESLEETAKS